MELVEDTNPCSEQPNPQNRNLGISPGTLNAINKKGQLKDIETDKRDFKRGNTIGVNEITSSEIKLVEIPNRQNIVSYEKHWATTAPTENVIRVSEDLILDGLNISSYYPLEHSTTDSIATLSNSEYIDTSHRSLTLSLEKNLKVYPATKTSSIWNKDKNIRVIRQSTVEGIKDYFNTIDRLERNSVSFISQNRRASLPSSSTAQYKKHCEEQESSRKVNNSNTILQHMIFKIKHCIES